MKLKKKCLPKCENDDDCDIQYTYICLTTCASNYKSYFYDKTETFLIYEQITCVLNCPKEKPFIYIGKCLTEYNEIAY